jgi:hypothetical protein
MNNFARKLCHGVTVGLIRATDCGTRAFGARERAARVVAVLAAQLRHGIAEISVTSRVCLATALIGLSSGVGAQHRIERVHLVRFEALDYAFRGPGVVRAGRVELRLINRGMVPHHLVISRLDDSTSLSAFYLQLKAGTRAALVNLGGPGGIEPGDSSVVVLALKPGRYAVTCWMEAGPGAPHVLSGMLGELRAADSASIGETVASRTASEVPSVRLRLDEYQFRQSGAWRRGFQVVELVNTGHLRHDLQLLALAPGRSVGDVVEWVEGRMLGPPPGRLHGGSGGFEPGDTIRWGADLRPGRYVMFCFVRAPDGSFHASHGMIKELHVP